MKTSRFGILAALVTCALAITAIATTPACVTTQAQAAGLATIADAAVVATVEKDSPTPAVKLQRAQKIKAIATQLKALDAGALASIPEVVAAVTPLINTAGLSAPEVILAQSLVVELTGLVQSQLAANPSAGQVQTTVQALLNDIILACGAYGA